MTAPSPYLPAEYEPDPIDVADIRKALIAESYEHFRLAKAYWETIEEPAVTTFEFSVLSAISAANTYAYLLAAVLHEIEERHGADEARHLAEMFDGAMEHGTEFLADANSDLDEQARPSRHALDVATTPGCFKCGIPFALDGPKAQEPGTTYCRVCADAGPTPADIEAALDAKAEDDRIEAERAR